MAPLLSCGNDFALRPARGSRRWAASRGNGHFAATTPLPHTTPHKRTAIIGSGTWAPLRGAAVEAGKQGRASRCRSRRGLRLTGYFRTSPSSLPPELGAQTRSATTQAWCTPRDVGTALMAYAMLVQQPLDAAQADTVLLGHLLGAVAPDL